MTRLAKEEWAIAEAHRVELVRLLEIVKTLGKTANPDSEEWRSWRDTADALDSLMWLHRLGCPLNKDDPDASAASYLVQLDPLGGAVYDNIPF